MDAGVHERERARLARVGHVAGDEVLDAGEGDALAKAHDEAAEHEVLHLACTAMAAMDACWFVLSAHHTWGRAPCACTSCYILFARARPHVVAARLPRQAPPRSVPVSAAKGVRIVKRDQMATPSASTVLGG